MSAVVAVTVMHVLLFMLHACALRECEGDGNAGLGSVGGVVAVSAYMGGTRGSGVLSSACDVLEISMMRGVGRVCDMCMCMARECVGGEWVRGLGLGFTNRGGTGGKCDMCLCFGCGGVDGVGVEWVGGLGNVVLSLCLL